MEHVDVTPDLFGRANQDCMSAGGVAALSQRVRHSFDPKIILNRGRMLLIAAT